MQLQLEDIGKRVQVQLEGTVSEFRSYCGEICVQIEFRDGKGLYLGSCLISRTQEVKLV